MSVTVVSYMAERTIEQAIRSVMSQTTPFPIEIIVYDDASTDNSVAIAEEVLREWPGRSTVMVPEENRYQRGLSPYFPILEKAAGHYIARLDADDYWVSPSKLSHQVSTLESDRSIPFSCTAAILVDQDGEQIGTGSSVGLPGTGDFFTSQDLTNGNFVFHSSVVFRKDLVAVIPSSWEELIARDLGLWGYWSAGKRFHFLHEDCLAYRFHDSNTWLTRSGSERLIDELQAARWLARHIADRNARSAWRMRVKEILQFLSDADEARSWLADHAARLEEAAAEMQSQFGDCRSRLEDVHAELQRAIEERDFYAAEVEALRATRALRLSRWLRTMPVPRVPGRRRPKP